jgi:hypothetical protein
MTKHELPRLPPDVDEAPQRSATSFADANLGQLFYALLDDEDVEEVLRDFLVPAGPRYESASHTAHAVSGSQREAIWCALGADASGCSNVSAARLLRSKQPVSTSRSLVNASPKVGASRSHFFGVSQRLRPYPAKAGR